MLAGSSEDVKEYAGKEVGYRQGFGSGLRWPDPHPTSQEKPDP